MNDMNEEELIQLYDKFIEHIKAVDKKPERVLEDKIEPTLDNFIKYLRWKNNIPK